MEKETKKELKEPSPITFLIPCFNTPMLSSDFLHTVVETEKFTGCDFVLLLEKNDPSLNLYKQACKSVREKGLELGYFIFDGTPYCGKINRIAPILNTLSLCVLDNTHMPLPNDNKKSVKETVEDWLKLSVEPMRVGVFNDMGEYPVVTKALIERLGYMFHTLCFGREEAEQWILALGENLGVINKIECTVGVSSNETVEVEGFSFEEDIEWVRTVLSQILEEEVLRLQEFIVR